MSRSEGTGKPGAVLLFLRQSWALLKKNLLIRARSWRLNLFHALQSIAIVFLIWAIDKAVSYSSSQFTGAAAVRNPKAKDVPHIPSCSDDLFLLRDQPCLTFMYTPNNQTMVERLVAAIRLGNNPPLPESEVQGMLTPQEVDRYLWNHPQTVLAAVHFTVEAGRAVSYILQTNASSTYFKGFQDPNLYIQLPLQAAIERAVADLELSPPGSPSFPWRVRIRDFPHPSLATDSVAGRVAPVFILASLMFNFVVLLSSLVMEKESGMRTALSTMGMMDWPYWLSWAVPELILGAIHAALLTAMARAFQFEMVMSNDFVLMLLLVFLSNTALMAFSCAVSTCIQKEAMAVPMSFTIFIIAWVLQLVVFFGFPYNSPSSAGEALTYLFSFFPWTLLSKGMLDLADATTGSWRDGISWDSRSSYCWSGTPPPSVSGQQQHYWQANCRMPLGQIYWVLLIQAGGYFMVAIYLDNILPRGEQSPAPQPWYFLCTPSFWWPRKSQDLRLMREALQRAATEAQQTSAQNEDEDVASEAAVVQRLCRSCCEPTGGSALPGAAASGLHLFGLRKVFNRSSWCSLARSCGSRLCQKKGADGRGKVAVSGTWLSVPEGQCFALLGPNGAGKTTSIKCLIGALRPSAGDALVYGHSIRSPGGMSAARAMTGVCPQFDVLWSELTAMEHLMLYSDIKGLRWGDRVVQARELLDKVALLSSADVQTGAFSGGMKRRLSVAVALLGDPRIVYLDEPTTGMDPVSRRQVWDLLDAAKRERVVVLTTHSMEEADVLGDRIGIFAAGKLCCLGTSLRLKTKFGSGYRVSILLQAPTPQGPSPDGEANTSAQGPGEDAGGDEYRGDEQGGDEYSDELDPYEEPGTEPRMPAGDTRLQLTPFGVPEALAVALEEYLGPEVLSVGASMQHTANDKLAPTALGQTVGGGAAKYLNVVVPQSQDRQLLLFLDYVHEHAALLGVVDVQMGLTPLEEVYLRVVHDANAPPAVTERSEES